jgi:hypothetical protein
MVTFDDEAPQAEAYTKAPAAAKKAPAAKNDSMIIEEDVVIEVEQMKSYKVEYVPVEERPRNWRLAVRADARRKERLKVNGKPDPGVVEKKRRKRAIQQAGKLAVGYNQPSRALRYGGGTDPGAYQSVPTMAVFDPKRSGSSFKTESKRIGVPPNKDIEFTLDSTYEEAYAKPPPDSYEVSKYSDMKTRLAEEAKTENSEFCSQCDRFDQKQINKNYRFVTDHQAPEMRFSMRREKKEWLNAGNSVPSTKRPDIWRQPVGMHPFPPTTDGADAFYKPKTGLAKGVKTSKTHRYVNYEVENAYRPRYPGCVLQDSITGGQMSASSTAVGANVGPGSHNPVYEGRVQIKDGDQFSSMFRSESSREPLFCQHPKLLLDRGFGV